MHYRLLRRRYGQERLTRGRRKPGSSVRRPDECIGVEERGSTAPYTTCGPIMLVGHRQRPHPKERFGLKAYTGKMRRKRGCPPTVIARQQQWSYGVQRGE
jgi:hypothetical protein